MTVVRLKDFSQMQAALIKSMYQQVRHKCNDGVWRNFDADITVSGQRIRFSCKFKLDEMFLTFAHAESRDQQNRLILPENSISMI